MQIQTVCRSVWFFRMKVWGIPLTRTDSSLVGKSWAPQKLFRRYSPLRRRPSAEEKLERLGQVPAADYQE